MNFKVRWPPIVIRVQEGDIFASRFRNSPISRNRRKSRIFVESDVSHAGVRARKSEHNLLGLISGTIVNNKKFLIRQSLALN